MALKDPKKNLSGYTYVAAYMRGESAEYAQIPIRVHCGHVESICPECTELWGIDYWLRFDRTKGGRALKARLPRDVAERAEMWVEVKNWPAVVIGHVDVKE